MAAPENNPLDLRSRWRRYPETTRDDLRVTGRRTRAPSGLHLEATRKAQGRARQGRRRYTRHRLVPVSRVCAGIEGCWGKGGRIERWR